MQGVPASDVADWCAVTFPRAGAGKYRTWTHLDDRWYKARWGFTGGTSTTRDLVGADGADDTSGAVFVRSTKWALAQGLAEIAVRWGLKALRDWRVSPEELLDLADKLLEFARRLSAEGEPGA